MAIHPGQNSAGQALSRLIQEEWETRLAEDPLFATQVGDPRYNDRLPEVSEAAEARKADQARAFLQRLQAIHRDELSAAERTHHEMLARELSDRVTQYEFGAFRMAFSRLSGPHSTLPDIVLLTPFQSAADYRRYITRLHGLRAYLGGWIELMHSGMRLGQVPPRAALSGADDSLRALLPADPARSSFYTPFQNFPPGIGVEERTQLQRAGLVAVSEAVIPGFRALLDFLQGEYLPAARETVGISALPGGAAYYAAMLRKFTTLDVTPDQVRQTGLAEVDRIRAEMEAIIRATGFQGSFQDFLHFLRSDPRFYVTQAQDLMSTVALILKRMDGELPRLFKVLPRTPYGMRQTPEHLAPNSTSAYYFPATGDGTTAGWYYVNTYDLPSRPLYEYEALSFHEAVPGHHLQLALQQEMTGVPEFRRYAALDAFIEGWALYAERLGLEVGFYQDPYSNFGRLIYEMWRATRLVVDTGLHAMGWSRERAIGYMADNTALSQLNIQNEVDRYIAWPGQAVAYKMGELKIRALRAAAEERLDEGFDLREFHRLVLEDGAIPLNILEEKIKNWDGVEADRI